MLLEHTCLATVMSFVAIEINIAVWVSLLCVAILNPIYAIALLVVHLGIMVAPRMPLYFNAHVLVNKKWKFNDI